MKLSLEEVENIADLARLSLTESEKKRYADELSVVLDYIKRLDEVNTDEVEGTSQVTGLEDVVRADEVVESSDETKKKIIEQFPQKMGNLLKVKAVFSSSDEE